MTECVSHQERGVDRHLYVMVGQYLGWPFLFTFFVAELFPIIFEEGYMQNNIFHSINRFYIKAQYSIFCISYRTCQSSRSWSGF